MEAYMVRWKKACAWILIGILCVGTGAGCAGKGKTEEGKRVQGESRIKEEKPGSDKESFPKLKVVTTLFPYYDFARQIAGDKIELDMVVPAGMDSHSFEPTPADMRMIQEADILICNGGAMEHWVSQVMEALDTSHMTILTMMDYVDVVEEEVVEGMEDKGHNHEGHDHESHEQEQGDDMQERNSHGDQEDNGTMYGSHGEDTEDHEIEYDEHIWTSPVNAMGFTKVITQALAQADPENRKEYEASRDAYLEKLEHVHQMFLQVAENRKRNVIVVGDKFPFRYLAKEYGFDYRAAFSGCSTDTEPSARTIAYLIDKVKDEKIPAVYFLELSSHRVSEIIGEETGAKVMLLHSCHSVTRREFDSGITYVDLMMQNAENLRKGLDE